jgi:plastocyanin
MPRRLLLIAITVLLATACGGTSVGGESLFNGGKQTPGNFNFANPSSSAAAAIGTQGAAPTPTARQAAPTAVPATPRPTPRPPSTPAPMTFHIAIDSDNAAQAGFQPANANVYQGTMIVFTNHDSKPRSVVSDPGDPASFNSGLIAPGASWTYTASTLGTFDSEDGTRQYPQGAFTVVAR